jgi:hypothetical protein
MPEEVLVIEPGETGPLTLATLDRLGSKSVLVNNAKEAVYCLRSYEIGYVITGPSIANREGLVALLRGLRPELKIIAMCDGRKFNRTERRRLYECGADFILTVPFGKENLARALYAKGFGTELLKWMTMVFDR